MNNTEKKLDALIDALGFDVEIEYKKRKTDIINFGLVGDITIGNRPKPEYDYKLTKRNFTSKPSLHKVVREYEQGTMSYGEMVGRIELMESDYENI